MDPASLIYDWNRAAGEVLPKHPPVELADETLRDGLQSPSVVSPSVEEKLELLHLMNALQIDLADIGLPGAGPHVCQQVERLAREIAIQKMQIRAYCAARTVAADILPIVEISQRTGLGTLHGPYPHHLRRRQPKRRRRQDDHLGQFGCKSRRS